jgi:hypothetical protein
MPEQGQQEGLGRVPQTHWYDKEGRRRMSILNLSRVGMLLGYTAEYDAALGASLPLA